MFNEKSRMICRENVCLFVAFVVGGMSHLSCTVICPKQSLLNRYVLQVTRKQTTTFVNTVHDHPGHLQNTNRCPTIVPVQGISICPTPFPLNAHFIGRCGFATSPLSLNHYSHLSTIPDVAYTDNGMTCTWGLSWCCGPGAHSPGAAPFHEKSSRACSPISTARDH